MLSVVKLDFLTCFSYYLIHEISFISPWSATGAALLALLRPESFIQKYLRFFEANVFLSHVACR